MQTCCQLLILHKLLNLAKLCKTKTSVQREPRLSPAAALLKSNFQIKTANCAEIMQSSFKALSAVHMNIILKQVLFNFLNVH